MNFENYFKDMFESIPDYKKIVLLISLNKDDKTLTKEKRFRKNDINQSSELKRILFEEDEHCLDNKKNEAESIIEKFLKK